MKISLNWLKEFVDLAGIESKEIVNRLTLSTAEIEGVEYRGSELSGVIVAQIVEIKNHPTSHKLHLLKVDTGNGILDVVCGAPNVKLNMKTAFATIGANVNGVHIEKAVVGGFESSGMCCSAKELGISDNNDGIMELDATLPLGKDLKLVFDIDDVIIEIDNKSLSNRPDLWGHYGFARELSAIFKRPLKDLEQVNLLDYDNKPKIKIDIASKDCLRYSCIKIENINAKISPVNMQIRLFYCGMRSISLLADLTNYIMLEIGQPMHAFDGEKVKSIKVANASDGENFVTLDGKDRVLGSTALMIKNENNINVCVAGVMGGLDSEICQNTTTLLLESATFDAVCVRKTANMLGLRSEASNRYEKSLDPELTPIAIARFIKILNQIDNGASVQSSFSDCYSFHYPQREINITTDFINAYCGLNLTKNEVVETLRALKFSVVENGEELLVGVPSFRATKDISIKADLVEEVARIYGYDNIKIKPLIERVLPANQDFAHLLEYDAKYILASNFGLSEVSTYIWENKQLNQNTKISTPCHLKVINALNKENDQLRSELVPSLLEVIVNNIHNYDDVRIFEIARVISGIKDNLAQEDKHLCIALSSKVKDEKTLYYEAKNCLTEIVQNLLNRELQYQINACDIDYLHPYNNAKISCEGVELGLIGLVHPKVLEAIDKKIKIAVVEIDFNKLASLGKRDVIVRKASKYGSTTLDFNFVVDNSFPYQTLKNVLSNFVSDLEFEFELKDVFKDIGLLGNKISYTFNFTVVSLTHTLTGAEIENFHSGLIEYAKKNGLNLR